MDKKLKYWLKPIDEIFKDFNKYILDKNNNKKHRIFIDRDSDILFVAHLDTVQPPKFIRTRRTKSKKPKRIYAQGLDDRLGCMLAYELSAKLQVDLLLTDHEEGFGSTAQYHDCKDYNWICEFDRAGSDVVTYDQDNLEFLTALEKYWQIGIGSFSDVRFLDTDACTMNLGIGYELAHSKDSYCIVKTVNEQIDKFIKFFNEYKNAVFVRDYVYNDYCNVQYCEVCGMPGADDIYGYSICQDCIERMLIEKLYNKESEIYGG